MSEFQVRKNDFAVNRVVETAAAASAPAIGDGEILVKIEKFAFSANNVTYALLGEKFGYWQFFPASNADAGANVDGWGVIPVWGFASVVATKTDQVRLGERLFGYFPPAHFLRMTPTRVSAGRLADGAVHRAQLPPAYNGYSRVEAEPGYDRALDDGRMLLWPLHMTSFCLWDMLQDKGWFGARQVVILSASSKTAIGLGYALAADASAPPVIGVTSAHHLGFVGGLGLYTTTATYEALAGIDAAIPTVIVDMSGNRAVLGRLHTHLGDNMKRCINVGLTHWDAGQSREGINAGRSEIFFAPGHIQQRMKEWGAEEFSQRTSTFLRDAAVKGQAMLNFTRLAGLDGLAAVYPEVCAGRVAPDQGIIVDLSDPG